MTRAPQGPETPTRPTRGAISRAAVIGIGFGVVLIRAEVVSWFRIQEMFRFQGFHMYGILGSAVLVAMVSIALIRRFGWRTVDGAEVEIPPKAGRGLHTRYWLGGAVFGLGWALLGACPGPVYALIGSGATVFIVALFSALLGTWAYGQLEGRLPH